MRVLFGPGLAALSKPRCGSTSLRRMLTPHMKDGDIKCDRGGVSPPFHPHITAPYLRKVLTERGHDAEALTYIITMRHPVDLLWSYWKFFKPDAAGLYSFSPGWSGAKDRPSEMDFETWVCEGRLGLNPDWLALAPAWISGKDLSPLNLESRIMDRSETILVDHVFRLEEPETLVAFFSELLGTEIPLRHANASEASDAPKVGDETMAHIRRMFPYESELYAL